MSFENVNATGVIKVKDACSGIFLKDADDKQTITVYLVTENTKKEVLVPEMMLTDYISMMQNLVPYHVNETTGVFELVLVMFSRGGNVPLNDSNFIEVHLSGSVADVQYTQYESIGAGSPLMVVSKTIKTDEQSLEIDTIGFDACYVPSSLDSIETLYNGKRVNMSKDMLESIELVNPKSITKDSVLTARNGVFFSLLGIETITLFEKSNTAKDVYLIDYK